MIQVSRVRVHSDGKVTGDINLILGAREQEEPTFAFNFSSSQTRKQLVNSLSEKYQDKQGNSEWQWLPIIDELCRQVQRLAREGEPVIEILSTDPVSDLEYLIYPIAPLGKPTVIFGDPDSGKSQLAVILSMIAILPWHDNPLKLRAPAESTKVLYLDFEADEDDIRRQLTAFTKGMGLAFCPLYYRRCSLPITEDLEGIRNHLDNLGSRGIVIDSISLAAGGDLNKMEVATAFFRSLRELKVTSISLAHTSKERESKNKTILGSVLFQAGARSIWECRANEDEDSLSIALFHRKANLSRRFDAIGLRINYDSNEGNFVEWLNPKSIPEFIERMSTNQRILVELKRGKVSTIELVEVLAVKRSSIEVALTRLRNASLIVGDSKGWGLSV